jgi:two-component system NarL family response regulator
MTQTPPLSRVMIVDDHPMVAQGVQSILETYDDLEVVATLSSGQEAIAQVGHVAAGRRC